jgi:hypothetical protein
MEGSVKGRKDGREEGKYGSMVVRKAKAERKERRQRGWDGRNKKGLRSAKRQERNPEVWMEVVLVQKARRKENRKVWERRLEGG